MCEGSEAMVKGSTFLYTRYMNYRQARKLITALRCYEHGCQATFSASWVGREFHSFLQLDEEFQWRLQLISFDRNILLSVKMSSSLIHGSALMNHATIVGMEAMEEAHGNDYIISWFYWNPGMTIISLITIIMRDDKYQLVLSQLEGHFEHWVHLTAP